MKIRYENRLEDLVAFNDHHARVSGAFRAMRRRLAVGVGTAWLSAAVFFAVIMSSVVPLVIGVLLVAVALPLLNWNVTRSTRRNVRRLLNEGANKTLYGWHELEFKDDQLIKTSLYMTTIMDLRLIERIDETPDYTFIYYSAVQAHAVPRRDVSPDEYDDFMSALRQRWGDVTRRAAPVES